MELCFNAAIAWLMTILIQRLFAYNLIRSAITCVMWLTKPLQKFYTFNQIPKKKYLSPDNKMLVHHVPGAHPPLPGPKLPGLLF